MHPSLRLSIALAFAIWPLEKQAQVLRDASSVTLDAAVMQSVLSARNITTQQELQRLASSVAQAAVSLPASDALASADLRLSPPGPTNTSGASTHPLHATHGFYELPSPFTNRTDDNGNPLAFCPFDLRGQPPAGTVGRIAGTTQANNTPDPQATAFAIIAPGNNGRFETTCEDLKRMRTDGRRSGSKTPSWGLNDDIVIAVSNKALRYNTDSNSAFGPTVDNHADLPAVASPQGTGVTGVRDGEVRLVRNLNQFYVARVAAGSTSIQWEAISPAMKALSRGTYTAATTTTAATDTRQHVSLGLLSGAMSAGSASWPAPLSSTSSTSFTDTTFTIGSRRVASNGSIDSTDAMAPGFSLIDASDINRVYVGLTSGDTAAFVIRHKNNDANPVVKDRLRIGNEGRLWLGDLPVIRQTLLTQNVTGIYGVTEVVLPETAGLQSYLTLGNTDAEALQSRRWAGMRVLSGTSGNHLELRVMQASPSGPVTGTGNILFNTAGNVGIQFSGTDLPQYKLDVNGDGRIRGSVRIDAGSDPNLTVQADSSNTSTIQMDTSGSSVYARLLASRSSTETRFNLVFPVISNALSLWRTSAASELNLNAALQVNNAMTIGSSTTLTDDMLVVGGSSSFNNALSIGGNLTVGDGRTATLQTLSALSAALTGAVSATQGLTVSSGFLVANRGINSTNSTQTGLTTVTSGSLFGSAASTSGLLSAAAGATVNNEPVRAQNGLTVSTNALYANSGFEATGDSTFNNSLRVKSDAAIDGNLTLNKKLSGIGDLTLNFYGYTNAAKTESRFIGSTSFNINSSTAALYLDEANPFLHTIDQSLSTSSTPTFNGLVLTTTDTASDTYAIKATDKTITTTSHFKGDLQGTATQARKMSHAISIRLFRNSGDTTEFATVSLGLDEEGDKLIKLPISSVLSYTNAILKPTYNADSKNDTRKVNLTLENITRTFNVTCKRSTVSERETPTQCSMPQNFSMNVNANTPALPANTYLPASVSIGAVSSTIKPYAVTVSNSAAGTASAPLAAKLLISSDFINTTSVGPYTLSNTSTPTQITLNKSNTLGTYATEMNQDVGTNSDVRFSKLTINQSARFDGLKISSLVTAETSAKMKTLSLVHSNNSVIKLNGGDDGSATFGGSTSDTKVTVANSTSNSVTTGTVTATNFTGTARFAKTFDTPISFTAASGSPLTITLTRDATTETQFNVSTSLSDSSLPGRIFVGIGDTKFALGSITPAKIKDREIVGEHLKDRLTEAKIDDLQILSRHIKQGSAANETGAVTEAKLADGAVKEKHIQQGAVTAVKFEQYSITLAKLSQQLQQTLGAGPSDIRLKNNIVAVDPSSLAQRLSQTQVRGFRMIDDAKQQRKLGVIAQELQLLFPELVVTQESGAHSGYLAVNYASLGAVAAAGAGELARRLDSLGLHAQGPGTLVAKLPVFEMTRLSAKEAHMDHLDAGDITTTDAQIEQLESTRLTAVKARSRHLQADTVQTGQTEGLASHGGLLLFTARQDGHYLVQVSSQDGAHASANVFIVGGIVNVVPISSLFVRIESRGGTILAIGADKPVRATWLKTA